MQLQAFRTLATRWQNSWKGKALSVTECRSQSEVFSRAATTTSGLHRRVWASVKLQRFYFCRMNRRFLVLAPSTSAWMEKDKRATSPLPVHTECSGLM